MGAPFGSNNGKKTQWVKGQSGNPAGGKGLTKEQKAVRLMNRDHVQSILDSYLGCDRATLKAILETPEIPMYNLIVGKMVWNAAVKGDASSLRFMLEILLGPMKQTLEIHGSFHSTLVGLINRLPKKGDSDGKEG